MSEKHLPPLDLTGPASQVANRWRKWKRAAGDNAYKVAIRKLDSYFRVEVNIPYYYMEGSVFLGTRPLVDSIRHFIRDPSGVFSVCHLCECGL